MGCRPLGHIITMKALLDAIGINHDFLDVVLYQMVHLFEDGHEVMMSKHTGNSIPFRTHK